MTDFPHILTRWQAGEVDALQTLIQRNLDWIRARVRQRLGDRMRRIGDSEDFLQETLLDFLKYTPRFRVENEEQFRGLLARVVESAIRDKNDYWFRTRRRQLSQERPLPTDSVLDLSLGASAVTPPDEKTAKQEMDALLRMAIEVLQPEDREVVVLRHWDDLEYEAIGERLGVTADGARKRYKRALPKLARTLERLSRGDIAALLET